MKKLVLAIISSMTITTFADNTEAFNQAFQLGRQNQFKLNLSGSSTIDSYSQANKFESSIANNANAGASNAKDTYSGASGNPNYLYNAGQQEITNCQNKSDPRCTTLNKYGDKDTQTEYQAYAQGNPSKYYINSRPDPADSSCSIITRKQAINPQTYTCLPGRHERSTCQAILSAHNQYNPPVPADGTTYVGYKSLGRDRATASVSVTFTTFDANTKNGVIHLHPYVDGGGFWDRDRPPDAPPYTHSIDIDVPFSGVTSSILLGEGHYDSHRQPSGNWTNSAHTSANLEPSPGCINGMCTFNFTVHGDAYGKYLHDTNGSLKDGGLKGTISFTEPFSVTFPQPQGSYSKIVYDYSDGCAEFRGSK